MGVIRILIYSGYFVYCHSIWLECALNCDLPIYCLRQMQRFPWSIKFEQRQIYCKVKSDTQTDKKKISRKLWV